MDFANSPSFFRHGPRPGARAALCAFLSLALLIGDSRFGLMERTREGLSVVLYPLQWAVNLPVSAARHASDFFTTQTTLKLENDALRTRELAMASQLARLRTLEREHAELRSLNALRDRMPGADQMAEVLYTGRDPFSYKLIIDKGQDAAVRAGQPVVDGDGLLGQVTRTQPLTAEVTLITDKSLMVPVMIERTGVRAILYGYGGGVDLRFLPAHADVNTGDILVTSGIDGVYPAGLRVARVVHVERNTGSAFARLTVLPLAGVQKSRFVLVMQTRSDMPARPAASAPAAEAAGRGHRRK